MEVSSTVRFVWGSGPRHFQKTGHFFCSNTSLSTNKLLRNPVVYHHCPFRHAILRGISHSWANPGFGIILRGGRNCWCKIVSGTMLQIESKDANGTAARGKKYAANHFSSALKATIVSLCISFTKKGISSFEAHGWQKVSKTTTVKMLWKPVKCHKHWWKSYS